MSLTFYDPKPMKNDYFTLLYLEELCRLCEEVNVQIKETTDLMTVKNSILLVLGQYLTPDIIIRIKENNNFLIVFDINDSTIFTETYGTSYEATHVDLIFKIAGVQKTKESYEVHIDDDLNYTREKKPFRGGNWGEYFEIVASNKVRSLPYPPWNFDQVDNTPYIGRNKLALVRGGHHYHRVQLFLHLLSKGLIDGNSMFPGGEYVHQFCDQCTVAFANNGGIAFDYVRERPDMPCRLKNWEHDFNSNCGEWNNSCIPRYYDFSELFLAKFGGFDLGAVEQAFHGSFAVDWKNTILNRYLLYADFKLIFSIYAPPRFWEGAEAHTVNLVPERMNDQWFFPAMEDGVHYITYKEDFSNLEEICSIDKEKFEYISHNCFELYEKWIREGNGYRISPNLLLYILREIEEANGTL